MLNNLRFAAALSLTGLALMSGCSTSKPPQTTSASPETSGLQTSTNQSEKVVQSEVMGIQNILALVPPDKPDPIINTQIQNYIKKLAAQGFTKNTQGVWMQTDNKLLANHQGTIPLPAASITKVATTLVALQTFGPEHQFITQIGATGPIENGVLQGDLVIEGSEDPLFVWEEAIALGNTLNQMGIKQVAGNLIIVGKFYMNFKTEPQIAGNLLKQAFNSKSWSTEAEAQYRALPPGTPRPQVEILGSVQVMPTISNNTQPLVRHSSYPVAELVKRMNRYSNNHMAEMLANAVGGAPVVAQKAAEFAGVPSEEIQLINGSGLGIENRISPRAACAMFLAIERYLQPYNMTIGDVFAIVGKDKGTLDERKLPAFIVVKSGTLNNVSSLAGAIPTQKQGNVWFAIMNGGADTNGFRAQQESLLKSFLTKWGAVSSLPVELMPNPALQSKTARSEIVK